MAKKIPSYRKRSVPISEKLKSWTAETLEAIRHNFKVQHIYPAGEVYAGWFQKNDNAPGSSWHSTGSGFTSFYGSILRASQDFDVGVREWAVEFVYDYYLKFVDMGVGRGRTIQMVNRRLSADHEIRYMSSWNPKEGSTQRPAIQMEFRFQTGRMRRYMASRYKYEAQVVVLNAIDGLAIDVGNGGNNT